MKNRFNFTKSELFKILVFSEMRAKRVGSIDFTLLGVFFFILFSLSLLVSSTNHGLMNSLVDTFLSKNRDGTVPVYATLNQGIDRPISKDILLKLKETTGIDAEIFVKADMSTGLLYGFENTKEKSWKGKFLFKESKIWKEYVSEEGSNIIVLNKFNFHDHFNYETYKLEIRKELNDKNIVFPIKLLDLKKLWLSMNILGKDQLVQFKIVWVDNIYDVTDTDFLLPMDIYAKQKYITRVKGYDKDNFNFRKVIDSLKISMYTHEMLIEEIKVNNPSILKVISKEFKGEIAENYFVFNRKVSKLALDNLIKKYRLPLEYTILEVEFFNKFEIINGEIWVYLNKEELESLNISKLNNDLDDLNIHLDDTSSKAIIKTKYKDVLFSSNLIAYAKGKSSISLTREEIENFKYGDDEKNFFKIDTLYNNSLKKLGFLTKVLDGLFVPYAIILIFIFLTLIISQIILIISHRKSQYAIAITKGLERVQIFDVLATQLIILTIISAISSFIFMKIMSFIVSYNIQSSTQAYIDIVDIKILSILPIYFSDLLTVLFIIVVISLGTSFIYMKNLNICNENGYIGPNMKG